MNKTSLSPLNKTGFKAVDTRLAKEIAQFGARDMDACMQCGNCSASCPLSTGNDSFPRRIYRYIQLGLRDKLLASPVPWLCYYCGECNTDCPRGAEPAETMMAARRWLTTQYDWTGLAKKLYLSEKWEFGALGAVALAVILLFVFFHGPVITDRMAVNTFAPVFWVEVGDLAMAAVLSLFLLSNAFRMYRFIMADTRVPLTLYITEARSFLIHFATQKRWRNCGDDKTRWLKHFILVTGYMTMMTLIIVCIRWFQVDDTSWHFTSIFGYYATAALLYLTMDMFLSRQKKEALIHRYSEPTDWLFLALLFLTTLTGILMHIVRLAGWPMGTYVIYVIHLAIAVPMLVIEVPFGKWSHMFYRPFAIFLSTVKEKALEPSEVDNEEIKALAGETFLTCIQCGTCAGVCPVNRTGILSPRRIMRQLNLDNGTAQNLDQAVWQCLTCHLCNSACPSGIDIIDITKTVRSLAAGALPVYTEAPLSSLARYHNPWNGFQPRRTDWAKDLDIPKIDTGQAYTLFTCCTTAYGSRNQQTGARDLAGILKRANVAFGTLGKEERCCADPAAQMGDTDYFKKAAADNTQCFLESGTRKLLTTSPHCYNTFKKHYPELAGRVAVEHYTELLDRLLAAGQIAPARHQDHVVTFHDPCYLGRHNGIYDAPRNVLKQIPGLTLVEMPNNRETSLCCGGGGGHAWKKGTRPLAVLRVQEALSTGADIIATACPFCALMLDDAIRETGAADRIRTAEISSLLCRSLNGDPNDTIQPSETHFGGKTPLTQEASHD